MRDLIGTGVTLGARGLFEDVLRPPSASEQQLTAEQSFAQQQLRGMNQGGQLTDRSGRTPESQEVVQPREAEETSVLRQSRANPFNPQFDPEADPGETVERVEELEATAPQRLQAEAARQSAIAQQQALQDARSFLSEITEPGQRDQMLGRFDFMVNASASGMDTSLITEAMPPSQREKLELAQARFDLNQAQSEAEADQFATGWLQQKGILPEDAPVIPGASDTLRTVMESREGKAVNWVQEGVDFVLGRIGETSAGTGATFMPGQEITAAAFTSGDAAVPVEQAIAEWKSVVERLAPPDVRERELARIEGGAWQRHLTKSAAVDQVARILQNQPDMDTEAIRESLKGGFTKGEIDEIIREGRMNAAGFLARPQ